MAEIYDGAPLMATLFIATVPKIAFLALLIKLYTFMHMPVFMLLLLKVLSVATIIFVTIRALYEVNIKRFLAYSTVINMGFVTLPLSLMTIEGVQASLIYFIIYLVTTAAFFSMLLILGTDISITKKEFYGEDYIYYLSEFRQHNAYSLGLAILLLSFAGIPPFAGFFVKLEVIRVLWLNNNIAFAFLVFLFSVILSIVYLRLIRIIMGPELVTTYQKGKIDLGFMKIRTNKVYIYMIIICILLLLILYPF